MTTAVEVQAMDELWVEIVGFVPKKEQKDLALKVVRIFEDNLDANGAESDHPMLRKASNELNGEEDEEDED
jgi:galactose-1-phosphate uridylyltransferase